MSLRRGLVSIRRGYHSSCALRQQQHQMPGTTSSAPLPPPEPSPTLSSRLKPVSPSFYTARPTYIDSIVLLEELERKVKRALQQANVLPVASSSSSSSSGLSVARNAWLKPEALSGKLGIPLKASQYRNVVSRLSALAKYRSLSLQHLLSGAQGQEAAKLARNVESTLRQFAKQDSNPLSAAKAQQERAEDDDDFDDVLAGTNAAPKVGNASSGVDDLGRAYARGRRKDASARVWIVPAKSAADTSSEGSAPSVVPSNLTGSVLINNEPLSAYFTRAAHREQVLYPLRLCGFLGAFNVFALARGGGGSGQAGAIAHGLARALVVHFQGLAAEAQKNVGGSRYRSRAEWEKANEVRELLSKDGILKRDPRVVERKKTGQLKARKAFTWVKR